MRGYAGQLHAQPAHTLVGGISPGSAQFSGTNSLSNSDAALLWNGTGSFTAVIWWYAGTLPTASQNEWIFSQTASTTTASGFGLRLNGSTGFLNAEFSGNPGGGQNPYRAVPAYTIVANRWYIIQAALFSASNQVACEVADAVTGTDTFNAVAWTTPGTTSATALTLGSGPSGTDGGGLTCINTAGRLDNLLVFNRALTGAEWTTLKNVVGGVPTGLDWAAVAQTSMSNAVAAWNLDKQNGQVVLTDNTGNGHNLTNNSSVTSGPERTM